LSSPLSATVQEKISKVNIPLTQLELEQLLMSNEDKLSTQVMREEERLKNSEVFCNCFLVISNYT
jgi:hypothetical protein